MKNLKYHGSLKEDINYLNQKPSRLETMRFPYLLPVIGCAVGVGLFLFTTELIISLGTIACFLMIADIIHNKKEYKRIKKCQSITRLKQLQLVLQKENVYTNVHQLQNAKIETTVKQIEPNIEEQTTSFDFLTSTNETNTLKEIKQIETENNKDTITNQLYLLNTKEATPPTKRKILIKQKNNIKLKK